MKIIVPLISTVVLLLLTIVTFSPIMNPPHCPPNWPELEANGTLENCITGANIGLGLMVGFVLPLIAIATLILWIVYIVIEVKKSKHK